ncbi:tyrosine-type recombinase/integrase [Cryobacterium luteum]|uniref:tyrosine-type recombinase/integrase n=1 Tax=Cryobacterium luteum TaxID=1424661 RepID=UPI0008BAF018|nr:tyrosine-type recombinase/integrase [Cryobacterium luteum]SEM73113.1 Site-specific recombinase XerD [Cryobacterium luteum]
MTDDWLAVIDRYLIHQRAGGSPETTISTRRQHLQHLARRIECGPWQVTGDLLLEWTGAQTWARETRRGRRSTFRSFYGWAHGRGLITVNPAIDLPRVNASEPTPRPAPDRVYHEALLHAGPRDRLILRLGAEIGMRRGEVAVVHSDDLVEDLVGWSLLVHGKGLKNRTVPLTEGVSIDLRNLPAGWAFPGSVDGHLSPRWVGKIVTQLMPGKWTMHTLRHRFATRAYSVDRDVFTVQTLLGHASPATTRRYVQLDQAQLRRTVVAASA